MKKILLITSFCILFNSILNAQVTTSKVDGGSVITNLSMGIKVNGKSTLTREWVILNDAKCPLQLSNDVGIKVTYSAGGYNLSLSGIITPLEPIVAYEIHHVLYNVFGEHIKTLSGIDVKDLSSLSTLNGSWYANENQVTEYLICVSYVAAVRTQSGVLWKYDFQIIQQELKKLQISYEESYKPKSKADDK
jgi:hypothetical protein